MAALAVAAASRPTLMRRAHGSVLVRLALGVCCTLPAVRTTAQPGVIARADSAFAAEDRALARRLYEEAVRADPAHSRAVFRLAQLEPSRTAALALYERYVRLEPRDPWGYMALGDHLSRMGHTDDALRAYERAQALAPNEQDVTLGRARVLTRAGRSGEAQQALLTWTETHPEDGEAWDQLGREQLRAGRPRSAEQSFERAAERSVAGAEGRARAAGAQRAPLLEPVAGYQRDSDGNSTVRSGATADFMIADGTRLGATGAGGQVSDAFEAVAFTQGAVRLSARPSSSLRLGMEAGFTGFGATSVNGAWAEPSGDVRLRWRAAPGGPAWELRAQHVALGTAPLLIANRVTRSDVRAMLEIPLGPLRLRGTGRSGVVRSFGDTTIGGGVRVPVDPGRGVGQRPPMDTIRLPVATLTRKSTNARLDAGAALVKPLGSNELSVRYNRVGYARASQDGYFAPRLSETVEAGIYLDLGSDGPVSLAADLGAGAQRTALQQEAAGDWKAAYRAWAQSAIALGSRSALWLELEAYDAPFAPLGVSAAPSWRFIALSGGLRLTLR